MRVGAAGHGKAEAQGRRDRRQPPGRLDADFARQPFAAKIKTVLNAPDQP